MAGRTRYSVPYHKVAVGRKLGREATGSGRGGTTTVSLTVSHSDALPCSCISALETRYPLSPKQQGVKYGSDGPQTRILPRSSDPWPRPQRDPIASLTLTVCALASHNQEDPTRIRRITTDDDNCLNRGGRIRTGGLSAPNRTRYQASPRPENSDSTATRRVFGPSHACTCSPPPRHQPLRPRQPHPLL